LVCCKWAGQACTWCGSKCSCSCTCDGAFPWTLSFTTLLFGAQGVGCAIALGVGLSRSNASCDLPVWLGVQIGVAVLVVAASWYIHYKIRSMAESKDAAAGQFARLKLLCNFFLFDVGACLFFVVLLFAFAWFIFGWFAMNNSVLNCDAALVTMANVAQIMSIVWPIGCFFCFILSACCGSSSSSSSAGHVQHHAKTQPAAGNAQPVVVVVQQPQPVVMQPSSSGGGVAYSFPSKY